MKTEMDFNDESKHGQVFCASGWCGYPEKEKIFSVPDKWRIDYSLPYHDHGQSIRYTRIDINGKMWVGNYEYESQANFCPVTGKEAPVKIDEPIIDES